MYKLKTTRKAVIDATAPAMLKSCEYCELQNLLYNHSPIAYTTGIYGWNFDVYDVYGLTICTGYRGMPGEDLKQVREYEKKASSILAEYKRPHEEKTKEIENLLKEFCKLNGGIILYE